MKPQECRRILNVAPGADLDEIKSAYRRLAFKYHPDLNSSPGAATRFREVNEAYVILKDAADNGYEQPHAHKTRQNREKASAKPKQGAKAYARQQRQGKPSDKSRYESTRSRSQKFYFKEEDVLKDLLNDPFARKVFEDIYSQVKKDNPNFKGPVSLNRRNLSLKLGKKRINLDLSSGLGAGVRSWFRSQLDYEQTVYFPAHTLMPGHKIKITVEQKFSRGPKTIEVTLPHNFVVGRPIRLKGLGRRLGPIRGDLLLRVLPKS
jgi:molecular chaperone DnaJ